MKQQAFDGEITHIGKAEIPFSDTIAVGHKICIEGTYYIITDITKVTSAANDIYYLVVSYIIPRSWLRAD